MAFRFRLNEPIEKGFRRIGLEQIDRAERQLTAATDVEVAIHETRKCLKRIRALVRLMQPGLGDAVFRAENARFRAIAALLAPARDSHILNATIATLEGLPGQVKNASLAALRKVIGEELSQTHLAADDGIGRALAKLATARKRFRRLSLKPANFSTVECGLEQSYRRGRRAFRAAYADGSDEAFHEWRKSVQQHWRHMALLSRAWPDLFEARIAAARTLSQILGEDHDLALVIAFARTLTRKRLPKMHVREVERLAKARQKELRRLARPRGRQLFVEGARGHSRRVAQLWAAAEEMGAGDEEVVPAISAVGEPQAATVRT
jgi:CHAD domain-containing protein